MSRDPNDKVSLTLRMPERLRQQIEERAEKFNRSLNNQVISDLINSVNADHIIESRFGSEHIAKFMQALASCFVLAQIQTGKDFQEDKETMARAIVAMKTILAAFVPNEEFKEELANPDVTLTSGTNIAKYAGVKFFSREDIPEPEWLTARLSELANKKP